MAFLHHQPVRCLGFDIAKDTITVADGTARATRTIANRRGTIRSFLKNCGADLAICEPTGGHERLLLEECLAAGLPVHRADTLKLKGFIRSFGTLGKTDAIDAARLADYGRERWSILPLWVEPGPHEKRLQALIRRRRDLIAIKVAEQNRAKAPGAGDLARSFKAVLATIQRQIETLDRAIQTLVDQSSALKRRAAVCTAMDGIGLGSAAALLATMPELGTMTRHQAAALAGLAPHPNDSGTLAGYRRMRGGRHEVRTILFMPALRAAAGKGEFAAFYKRLLGNGKKPIAALAAVMRKIIVTLNARLRDDKLLQS
jgi:transposase